MAQFNQTLVWTGLGTQTLTVPTAGPYFFDGKITLSTLTSSGQVSSLVVTINQNGTPVYTGVAGAQGFHTDITCAAGDTITIVFSSAATADQPINAIKCVIGWGSGE